MLVYNQSYSCMRRTVRKSHGGEKLSSYASSLNVEAKTPCLEKIEAINGMDPFSRCLRQGEANTSSRGHYIVAYWLVLQTSFLTTKQFKGLQVARGI